MAQVRVVSLLEITHREGKWLQRTDARLFGTPVDAAWVRRLETDDDLAERLDAFVSRFGRLQDTTGDKLIPAVLLFVAEKTGSAIDNLNRAEKLGLLESVQRWLDTRNLRNRLIHEYMSDPEEFAVALNQAHELVVVLIGAYNAIHAFVRSHLQAPVALPPQLPV